MERRDALKALIALPAVTRIARAEIEPDDVIVVECSGKFPITAIHEITDRLGEIWPGHKVVICDDGIRIRFAKA